jgi:hypothetical protein
MLESISTAFSSLSTAANTAKVFKELLKNKKGDSRALLEELKENLGLCWLVAERDTDPMKVVPELATIEYDRLLREGFDFNQLNKTRKIIKGDPRLSSSDLSSFIGRDIAHLVEGIYDRIKELKRIHRVDKENPRIDWQRRVYNLHKRILLLMLHLQRQA